MAQDAPVTPMMAQYRQLKKDLPPDALLLFRLGDFYEMFFEDAQNGAQLLNVALTKRGSTPMCGIPFHAATSYISKLLKAGRKVAICEQVEEARPGQLVRREVTQILSPGTHFDERILAAERNNFLCSVYAAGETFGLAAVDLTTGEFKVTELQGSTALAAEFDRLRPAEIIYPDDAAALPNLLQGGRWVVNPHEGWVFAPETAQFTLRDHFGVVSLDGFGLRNAPAAIGAAGGVLHYLKQHLRRNLAHITRLSCYQPRDYLVLDQTSLRNLEVIEPLSRDAARSSCLYGALHRTVTPMGARRLRDWLSQPLASLAPLRRRQDAVAAWLSPGAPLADFRSRLAGVRDLERTISRLSVGSGNARDALALRDALAQIPLLRKLLADIPVANSVLREAPLFADLPPAGNTADSAAPLPPAEPLINTLMRDLEERNDLVELISRALVDDPPLALKEGGLIRDGFDSALDELKTATREGRNWIVSLQQKEIEQTGIPSLKVRFNSVFGYYIEITRTHLDKVPPHYVRKQTISNGERFITPALKEMEGKILGAEERSVKLEYELFQRVRENILEQLGSIQKTAQALAQLDVLTSFSETARLFRYSRPDVRNEGVISIQEGRHPVLDQAVSEERFVANDTELNGAEQQIAIITGPNMAGKSTYIRQVALLALLAHTGSFIPATQARIDLIDRIFTRIGASDDLSRGQSTFMVEMSETANILNNATSRSLIILDEIGRGTSTFDGLSLAWSIVEFLHHRVGAKTLFATHYHELTELKGKLPRVRNYNVAVREWNEQIIFLRKIVEGGTDKSYGIQVARLAGVPKEVLERAREILSNLEETDLSPGQAGRARRHRAERAALQSLAPSSQLDLFG